MNYAEACIELGGSNLQKGIDAMNMVRNRAGLPDRVTADQAVAREYVRHERNIEFFAEGHRFYDLVRWGIAEPVLNSYLAYESKKLPVGLGGAKFTPNQDEYMPIPQTQLDRQPGVLKQIQGY